MEKYNNQYRIPSARAGWHSYDGGYYFVTICTHHREHYFGEIIPCRDAACHVSTNELGKYVTDVIEQATVHCPYTQIPLFVVMPNHIHLIVWIDENKTPYKRRDNNGVSCRDVACLVSTNMNEQMQYIANQQGWLSVVIGSIKSAITKYANTNEIPFQWQTRFHDRIIRDYEELNHIAQYIENNPAQWEYDELSKPYLKMNEYEKTGMYL